MSVSITKDSSAECRHLVFSIYYFTYTLFIWYSIDCTYNSSIVDIVSTCVRVPSPLQIWKGAHVAGEIVPLDATAGCFPSGDDNAIHSLNSACWPAKLCYISTLHWILNALQAYGFKEHNLHGIIIQSKINVSGCASRWEKFSRALTKCATYQ